MHRVHGTEVVLRKFEPKDVEDLWQFRNDPVITRSLGGFSTGYSRTDLAGWVEAHRTRQDEVLLAIVDTENDRCIGHVGLYEIDYRTRKAEFAILIGFNDYHGRGLGEAITRWMVDYGFRQLNLNKVTLTVLSTNERALRLYEKIGFLREGIARQDVWRDGEYLDVVGMSILQDEWARADNA